MSKMNKQTRYRGAMLGLACGDAVGTTLEFKAPGTFSPIDDMVGGGPFRLQPGQWTDDTSLALCLAESLITQRQFDPVDQMKRYVRWPLIWGMMRIRRARCMDSWPGLTTVSRIFQQSGANSLLNAR